MWKNLPKKQKERYKKLITNFASLSEAFAQKSQDDQIISPIVNSKFQEKAFQVSFDATVEDINNTSYDASILTKNNKKYLVGIKSFGINSGDQKIAQFKKSSPLWEDIMQEIKKNCEIIKDDSKKKKVNNDLYLKIAKKVAKLRNERIKSSRAQLTGFKDSPDIETVYHVLMPSKKGSSPLITVGETSYLEIDIDNITVEGCTTKNGNPNNFKFRDPYHEYKYTASDSQLLMNFENNKIGVEEWEVHYKDDSISFFENMNKTNNTVNNYESYSWFIYDENGIVPQYSGFNAFNGQSKLSRANNAREQKIQRILANYRKLISDDSIKFVKENLDKILLTKWTNNNKEELNICRKNFIKKLQKIGNKKLLQDIENSIYRPRTEVYIPIPDSRNFHNEHPDFFGKGICKLKPNKTSLLLDKDQRTFTLRILPSGERIKAYVNQDNGKSIQSYKSQSILGEWLLEKVFQLNLDNREILTKEKLDALGFNGIRIIKNTDKNCVDLKFIEIDKNNLPYDIIGWAKNN
ncbi:hypothetical protein LNP07_04580 [Apilactobacillus sp. M161]|uniref:Restriction endonuclease type II NgoFVII C-terminal B3-like DNA-binding domain-containing protein n=1 Tax=Apilactobacillus xinyiensis TaxID=2841032 RepID=A0ABT0I249_9LACO|nr:hypothetical protein [Apilactobacillus xinyiensis]MCK8624787.1 hypothetical protein [Apilactobacillus xinyiensis]